ALSSQDISNLYYAAGIMIKSQPQSLAVLTGSNATLSVSAQGAPTLGYQWFNGTTAVGTSSSSYTITAASGGDAGNYTAVITNATDVITRAVAAVSVVNPPANAYATSVLALGPLGYWPLTEASGSTIAVNYGSLGYLAGGTYEVGTSPGASGPNAPGFGGATTA